MSDMNAPLTTDRECVICGEPYEAYRWFDGTQVAVGNHVCDERKRLAFGRAKLLERRSASAQLHAAAFSQRLAAGFEMLSLSGDW